MQPVSGAVGRSVDAAPEPPLSLSVLHDTKVSALAAATASATATGRGLPACRARRDAPALMVDVLSRDPDTQRDEPYVGIIRTACRRAVRYRPNTSNATAGLPPNRSAVLSAFAVRNPRTYVSGSSSVNAWM